MTARLNTFGHLTLLWGRRTLYLQSQDDCETLLADLTHTQRERLDRGLVVRLPDWLADAYRVCFGE